MRKHFTQKPRNPIASALRSKRSAAHGKTRKAERRAENMRVQKLSDERY